MSIKAFEIIRNEILEYLTRSQVLRSEYDEFIEFTYLDLQEKAKLAGSAVNCNKLEEMFKKLKRNPKALELYLKSWVLNYKTKKKKKKKSVEKVSTFAPQPIPIPA
jgi:hypothetical protein